MSLSKSQQNQFALELSELGLQVGETTYKYPCPSCGQDKSFSVTRNEFGYLYNCFRDSCGIRGFHGTHGEASLESHRQAKPKEEEFNYPKLDLQNVLRWVEGWRPETLAKYGIKYDAISHRLYIPTYSGFTLRRTNPKQNPKNLTYRTKKGFNVFYAVSYSSPEIFLVEDCFSAINLHQAGFNAVALLGTSLPEDFPIVSDNKYYVWLDADAIETAVKIVNKIAVLGSAGIVYTVLDPKHYNLSEIKNLVKEQCGE